MAREADLAPDVAFDVSWAFRFDDEDAVARGMLAPGNIAEIVRDAGDAAVRDAIVGALAPYRTPDGGYRLVNEWHFLVAHA